MAETIPVARVTQEQYHEGLKRRLLQSSLSQGVLYTLMFELVGDDKWAGATTAVEFENIQKVGIDGKPAAALPHFSLFKNHDYLTVARVAGIMRDDFVILDEALELVAPDVGTLKRGFVLPHDDGVDTTSLVTADALELVSSVR